MGGMMIALAACALAAAMLLILYIRQRRKLQRLSEHIEDYLAGRAQPLAFSVQEDSLAPLHNAAAELEDRHEAMKENLVTEGRRTGDLIADISHQLKTPLASLKLYCEMDEGAHMSQQIAQIERMEKLIHALLRLERLCADGYAFEFEERDVGRIVENAWNSVQASWSRVELIIVGQARIRCDAKWLEEAFLNLIKNACEQQPDGGRIIVTMEQTDNTFFCSVEDEGGGVNRRDLPHLFERFYRAKNASPKGAGLGLAIVREIIERHHGHVHGENTDKGLRISITIPILDLAESCPGGAK